MKKTAIILSLGLLVFSCKNDKKTEVPTEDANAIPNAEAASGSISEEINWEQIPEIENIGKFPFVTVPVGLKIKYDKGDSASELFPNARMEVYNGKSISTEEGKLSALSFESENGSFDRNIFEKNLYSYFDKLGSKVLYKGSFPEDEEQKMRLEKNLWNGKNGTYGIFRESDAPFSSYAFRNNGKNYVATVQANSAQGNVFVMEVAPKINKNSK